MTRWVMAADLTRCVGCQTCTAACKQHNSTAPGVNYRRVLDMEVGEYPNVDRIFVPTGCQHCADAPCQHVCPSKATYTRPDGIVEIDEELCIGCGYCAVACPYDARYIIHKPEFAYGDEPMAHEAHRYDKKKEGIATKCNYCADKIDDGLEKGLVPGVDPDATPACVNSCISGALFFGDIEDPDSPVSKKLAKTESFRMHEELGTKPGFYYITDANPQEEPA